MFVVCTMLLTVYRELLVTTLDYTYLNLEIVCNKLSSIKCSKVDESSPFLGRDPQWLDS